MAFALRDPYGKKYSVGSRLQIGSDPANQIVLWEQEGVLYLQDGSGGTATFVNGSPIQGIVALKMGDQVVTGNTSYMIEDLNTSPSMVLPPYAPSMAAPVAPNYNPPSALPAGKAIKKRKGCGAWILTALLVFISECVLIGVAGFILARTDIEIAGGFQDLKSSFSSSKNSDVAPSDDNKTGPAILKLSDQWLTGSNTNSFSQHMENSVEGTTPENTPFSTGFIFDTVMQNTPEWMSSNKAQQIVNGEVTNQSEKDILNGMVYSVVDTCSVEADPSNGVYGLDDTPVVLLTKELTGHVKLVEEGVTINGFLTDRYEIRKDNFIKVDTVIEVIEGSLYRAREGGYLVQLDYVVKLKPQTWVINTGQDFSDTEPSTVTYHFDRTYAPDGSLTIEIPEVCASQVPKP